MADAPPPLSTKCNNGSIYLRVYESDQKGHKLPLFVNFRKSPDDLVTM